MAKKATTKKTQTKETKVTETAPAKTTTKKCAAKKVETTKEAKKTLVVEYQGKQVEETVMFDAVEKAWVEAGNKAEDIKTVTLYVKPEEEAVYYVINETETGSIAF